MKRFEQPIDEEKLFQEDGDEEFIDELELDEWFQASSIVNLILLFFLFISLKLESM